MIFDNDNKHIIDNSVGIVKTNNHSRGDVPQIKVVIRSWNQHYKSHTDFSITNKKVPVDNGFTAKDQQVSIAKGGN